MGRIGSVALVCVLFPVGGCGDDVSGPSADATGDGSTSGGDDNPTATGQGSGTDGGTGSADDGDSSDASTSADATTGGSESADSTSGDATTDDGDSSSDGGGLSIDCYDPELFTGFDPGPWVASTGPECIEVYGQHPSMSQDGRYVAFTFAPTDEMGHADGESWIVIKDNLTGEVADVPFDVPRMAMVGARDPQLSADGSVVAFVAYDGESQSHLVVYDAVAETLELLASEEADAGITQSMRLSIDDAGERIAARIWLTSDDGPPEGNGNLFVFDRIAQTMDHVDAAQFLNGEAGATDHPAISGDGSQVIFGSTATNLAPDTPDAAWRMYAYDVETHNVEWLSAGQDLDLADAPTASVSTTGRFVAFRSLTSLPGGDPDGFGSIYVLDRDDDSLEHVGVTSEGDALPGIERDPSISGDGLVVAFRNDVNDDTPRQAFAHNRTSGVTAQLSVAADDADANEDALHVSVSRDGTWVGFASTASNLLPMPEVEFSRLYYATAPN